jgi:septal ring factor EnvC (AmiA/AmiB activator)
MSGSIAPDPEPSEAERPSADIIPFPFRFQTPEERSLEAFQLEVSQAEATPQEEPAAPRPEDRLAKALASLNAALAEQRIALASWREALGELKTTTTGLGDSLKRYHSSLGTLNGSVTALRDQAQSLEKWADGVLAD